jgi:NAD(P)-dependent dehydrogenase (short-subunit alcohol dehydrogenase family)
MKEPVLLTGGGRSTGVMVRNWLNADGHCVTTMGSSKANDIQMDLSTATLADYCKVLQEVKPAILINLAGVTRLDKIENVELEDWEYIMRVNLTAPFLLSQGMVRNFGGGRIINVASMAWRHPLRHSSAYCASKAGLVQLTRQMAKELGRGWIILAVCPGNIEGTDMTRETTQAQSRLRGMEFKEAEQYARSATPMMRNQSKEEVARMIMMAIDAPQYMTGSILEAPGGAS